MKNQKLSVKEHTNLFTKKEMLTVSQMNEGTTKDMNKIEETADNLGTEKKEAILQNFDTFTDYLSQKVHVGKKLGLSEEQLTAATKKVASYLAENEEPRNREEKVLHELWKVSSEEEKEVLSHLILKLVA